MSYSTNPQNGVPQTTVYPFDYQRHPQTIEETTYVVSIDLTRVTCQLRLSAGVIISGTHEQHHDINIELFKKKAYEQAIENLERIGYKLKN